MIELFGSALVTFLVIIDPPGCAPIFASLTRGTPPAHRRAMAIRSSLIAWSILMFFALLGRPMLNALHISLASFRIAGGIMLFFIALDMVFERRTERREQRAQQIEGTPEAEDISVFPMAMPMITGPGSIASASSVGGVCPFETSGVNASASAAAITTRIRGGIMRDEKTGAKTNSPPTRLTTSTKERSSGVPGIMGPRSSGST